MDAAAHSQSAKPAARLHSIFPTYDPSVSLEHQQYAPQVNPAIPRAVISRQSHYESDDEPEPKRAKWPLRIQTQPPPAVPKPCSVDDLQSLWKVANGWKASASEGRVYTLKLTRAKDAPVYTLSCAGDVPFWKLRLDPTSASAYVTLSRHGPSKSDSWAEALTTTLEEKSRKHPPHDGLVALLMPSSAARMALDKANDVASVTAAENECGRLVWDDDTATHFLVHNALAKPFCVSVDKSPGYSRTEYTLEHNESPRHLAKLTKDGTGGGWIEVDTGVAALIDAFYVLDVAVAALLLAGDESGVAAPIETFEPPPKVLKRDSRGSALSLLKREEKTKKPQVRMEEFDVESQESLKAAKEEKLPFPIRAVIKLTKGVFSLLIWVMTVLFKCVLGVFKVCYSCVGSKY